MSSPEYPVDDWRRIIEASLPPDASEAHLALRGLVAWGYDQRESALSHEVTGLPNRRALEQKDRIRRPVTGEHRRQREPDGNFALYVDLDNFKLINDVLGHETGDTVLRVVGQVLDFTLREEDELYHVGGDEFFVFGRHFPDQPDDIPSRIEARFNENLERVRSGEAADILSDDMVLSSVEREAIDTVEATFGTYQVGPEVGRIQLHSLAEEEMRARKQGLER